MASFLKYAPNEKFPSISKNVWCRRVWPTLSRSLCLPPARTHFWLVVAVLYERFSRPRKMSLNWFIPALMKSSVGSCAGIREELLTMVWPRSAKNWRNRRRISLLFMMKLFYFLSYGVLIVSKTKQGSEKTAGIALLKRCAQIPNLHFSRHSFLKRGPVR